MIPDPHIPNFYIFEDYFSFIGTFYPTSDIVKKELKVHPEVKMNPVNRDMPEICAFHPGELNQPKPIYLLDKMDQVILDMVKKTDLKIEKHNQDPNLTESDRDSPFQ